MTFTNHPQGFGQSEIKKVTQIASIGTKATSIALPSMASILGPLGIALGILGAFVGLGESQPKGDYDPEWIAEGVKLFNKITPDLESRGTGAYQNYSIFQLRAALSGMINYRGKSGGRTGYARAFLEYVDRGINDNVFQQIALYLPIIEAIAVKEEMLWPLGLSNEELKRALEEKGSGYISGVGIMLPGWAMVKLNPLSTKVNWTDSSIINIAPAGFVGYGYPNFNILATEHGGFATFADPMADPRFNDLIFRERSIMNKVRTYLAGNGIQYPSSVEIASELLSGLPSVSLTSFLTQAQVQAKAKITPMTDTQFITSLYQNVLRREPDPGGLTYWISDYVASGRDQAGTLKEFISAAQYAGETIYSTTLPTTLEAGFLGDIPTWAAIAVGGLLLTGFLGRKR